MCLRVYFRRTFCHTTWSTAHVYYVILSDKEHASSAHETLAYTTRTTSKHQRAT